MTRDRFASAETKRLELSDGDWVDVRSELSVMEKRRLEGVPLRGVKETDGEPEIGLNWGSYQVEKILTWVVGWSFTRGGQPVVFTRQAVQALKPEDADEVERAIDKYQEELAASKNSSSPSTGQSSQSPTSSATPSLTPPAGLELSVLPSETPAASPSSSTLGEAVPVST